MRGGLIRWLGKRVYLFFYIVLTLSIIAWIAVAYMNTPYVEAWPMQPWMAWVALAVMPLACVLLVASLGLGNWLSVSLRSKEHQPLFGIVRHPLMGALTLWAVSHMIANGDAASIVMFGLLALLSAMGPRSIDAKKRVKFSEEQWQQLTHRAWSFKVRDGVVVALGLVLYGVLLWAHPFFMGVSPLIWLEI